MSLWPPRNAPFSLHLERSADKNGVVFSTIAAAAVYLKPEIITITERRPNLTIAIDFAHQKPNMPDIATEKDGAVDQVDGASERSDDDVQNYKQVRAAFRDFATRAQSIERRADEATRGVKQMMLHQVQLARATDEVLKLIRHLAEHYKRMNNFADTLLLPHNYVLSDRMMKANVEDHYLWMTNDFLTDAKKGLDEADKLVEAQEYMEKRRGEVHDAVSNIKQLTAATKKLARDLDAFVPRVADFFHGLQCGCDPNEGCFEHDWDPKSKIDREIRHLDNKAIDILASLEALLQRLASDAGKRPASPRPADAGEHPLDGVYQANIDKCVIGSCCACGSDDHATAFCPIAKETFAKKQEGTDQPADDEGLYMMSSALQTMEEDEPVASDNL